MIPPEVWWVIVLAVLAVFLAIFIPHWVIRV